MWACGINGTGQLGDGTTADKTTAVQVAGLCAVTGIVPGTRYEFINDFKIYPNPNTGIFTIEMEIPETQNIQLKIFSILGQTIYTEKLNNIKGNYKKQIDLSVYPASGGNANSKGIYNLQLISVGRNGIPTRKTMINKKIIIE